MSEGRIIKRYALLGLFYFLAASATISFTRFDEGVSCLWFATGILVAVLVSTPRRTWKPSLIACGLGSFFATGIFGLGWLGAFAFVAVNLLEAIVVARLLKRHISGVRALGSLDWFERFLFAAGIAGPLAGATIAASWFLIMGIRVDPVLTFLQFFAGHALGNLTITPMAMLIGTAAARRSTWKQLTRNPRQTLTVTMLVAFVAAAVFSQQRMPLMFLPIVPIILACFRTGREGAALGIAILALVGGLLTALGQGPIQMLDLGIAGRIFYFQVYLAATVLTVLPISADLTNRRYLHRRLRDSEWRLRLITDFSTDVIFKLDADGTIRYVTPSVRQLGYTTEELIGRNCAMLVDPRDLPDAKREHWRTVALGGATNRFEYRAMGADGSCHWFESHARMIVNDRGEYEGMVSIARNTSDRKATESQLRTAALTDPLTGLPNRRAFRDHAAQRLNAVGSGDSIAVLDIDHFKRVNDRYGHEAGDEVLRAFSDIARRIIRDDDFIARMGGEEFAILFPDTSGDRAKFICERLRLELAGAIIFAGTSPVRITVSGGVAALGLHGIDHALKTADEALYQAKEDGRDRLTIAA